MTLEEMKQRVQEAYGSDGEAIIAAYRQDYPRAPIRPVRRHCHLKRRIPAFARIQRLP
jgi:hypothetical protein